MKHTLARGIAALVAAAALTLTVTAEGQSAPKPVKLAEVLPPQTLALLSVPDLQASHAAFQKTRLYTQFSMFHPFVDYTIKGLAGPIDELKGEVAKNLGMSLDAVLKALAGGLEVALVGIDMERGMPHVVAAIRMDGREQEVRALVAALEKASAEQPSAEPFTHGGIGVKAIGQPPIFMAEVGASLVLSLTPDHMKLVIDRATGTTPPAAGMTLATAPTFAAARKTSAEGRLELFTLYIHIRGLVDLAGKDMGERERGIFEKLELNAVEALDIALTFDGESLASRTYLHAPAAAQRQGVLGLFDHGGADLAGLKFAPKTAQMVFLARFDAAAVYDRVIALAQRIEPGAKPDMDRDIANFHQEIGFDLRKDLLGSVGSDWVASTFMTGGDGLGTFAGSVGVKDGPKVLACLQAIASKVGAELKTLERDGHTYHYLLAPLGDINDPLGNSRRGDAEMIATLMGFAGKALAFEGGRMYMADTVHSLADYFDEMAKGGSFADHKDAVAAVGKLAGRQVVIYTAPATTDGGAYDLLLRLFKVGEGFARRAGIPLDVNRLPRSSALMKTAMAGSFSLGMDANGVLIESRGMAGGADVALIGGAVIGITAAIAVPNLIEARKGANEAAAIGALRTIVTCQTLYREMDKDGNGVLNYAVSLEQLQEANLIDPTLGSGMKQGYTFYITSENPETGWRAEAHPISPGETGSRYFFVDESGVIRYEFWQPAGPESTPIGG